MTSIADKAGAAAATSGIAGFAPKVIVWAMGFCALTHAGLAPAVGGGATRGVVMHRMRSSL